MTARILIVDDRAVVRAELKSVLELLGGIAVVGEAADGREAVRQARALNPDIVLMDLEMPGEYGSPGIDGFEATRQIKAQHLARAVIVLTVYADDYHRQKAHEAGADAFIIKGAELSTIMESIESFMDPEEHLKGFANL